MAKTIGKVCSCEPADGYQVNQVLQNSDTLNSDTLNSDTLNSDTLKSDTLTVTN